MSAYKNSPFAVKSVNKSTGFTGAKTMKEKEEDDCKEKLIPLPRNFTRMVTGVSVACHPDTGKDWLVQDVLVWNEKGGCWDEECEGIHEMPTAYKASKQPTDTDPSPTPVVLPSFDGPLSVYVAGSDDPVTLYGGSATPVDMIGTILCINGELCYVGDKPIKAEVQYGGTAEEAFAAGVKIWIDGTTQKGFNDQGQPIELD